MQLVSRSELAREPGAGPSNATSKHSSCSKQVDSKSMAKTFAAINEVYTNFHGVGSSKMRLGLTYTAP